MLKIVLHESGPPEGAVYGTPPFLLRSNTYCGECEGYHDIELCPDCGADVYIGFGVGIAPGFGEWKVCELYCGWFWKHALPNDEC